MKDIYLCADEVSNKFYAMHEASRFSKQLEKDVYIYSNEISLHATTSYSRAHRLGEIGMCYPDGRIEWKRIDL